MDICPECGGAGVGLVAEDSDETCTCQECDGTGLVPASAGDAIGAKIAALMVERKELIAWGRRIKSQASALADEAFRMSEGPSRQSLALYDTATVFAPSCLRDKG